MRPINLVGWLLVAAGAVILLLGGISYTKERNAVRVGSVEFATEQKGFVPPVVGVVLAVVGGVILFGKRRRA